MFHYQSSKLFAIFRSSRLKIATVKIIEENALILMVYKLIRDYVVSASQPYYVIDTQEED